MNIKLNKDSEMPERFLSDEKLQQITGQIFIGHGILVAFEMGLFNLLMSSPKTAKEISNNLRISKRSAQALISCVGALDLLKLQDGKYLLTELGKAYFDESSPSYYGEVLSLLIGQQEIMSYSTIKEAILSGSPQVNRGKDLFSDESKLGNREEFVTSLHHKAFNPAFYWQKILNFSEYKKFVDIGGGSGVHTIATCLNNPHLRGFICEREPIVPITRKYVCNFNLEKRVNVINLNMWEDSFPSGDVYFFGDIFHDWPMEKCLFLARKSYDSLPRGGMIVLHEMLYDKAKIGPFLTSGYNMKMLVWTEGQQYSSEEMTKILKEVGFKKISIKPSLGNWSIVTGKKL